MSKVSTTPPSGFRDFLPHEAATRLELVNTITQIYRSHGFQPIGMPVMENLSTLQGKGGGTDNEKLIFKVMRRGEDLQRSLEAGSELADMGMRFDLTLPLARYCARFREQLPKPFKVFQIGPVWRADRPQKGRFREFFQCDVDIVGSKELGAEVDCISAILEVFSSLGMKGVEVHLNDRRLLAALKDPTLSTDQWADALVALDKLDKIGRDGVMSELKEKFGTVPEGILLLLSEGDSLDNLAARSPESTASLEKIISLLRSTSGNTKVVFNPTLVRGQDYYTGTIFEIRHPDLSGSLAGGGRYNRLLEVFGSPETPAFGGSIGFERLFLLLQEQNRTATLSGAPQFFLPLFDESLRAELLALAAGLRSKGLTVDVFPDAAKLKHQFKYADDRKIPFTLIFGGDEAKQRQVKLKDMAKGSETSYSIDPPEHFFEEMKRLCSQN